jgi:hypothetical protein
MASSRGDTTVNDQPVGNGQTASDGRPIYQDSLGTYVRDGFGQKDYQQ